MMPIYEAVADPRNKRITIIMASQMAKTELLLNVIGESVDTKSQPIQVVLPSERLAKDMSVGRFGKMVRLCPSLLSKMSKERGENLTSEKWIAGNRIGFVWASSAIQLCSHPAALIVLDERDRMANDIDHEGDPVELISARTTTYPNKKLIITTTPTIKGASAGWKLFLQGTQHKWHLSCLNCGKLILPSIENFSYETDPYRGFLICQHCKTKFPESSRELLLAHGQYVIEKPAASNVSFWISGLCSPWRSWDEVAKQLDEAEKEKSPSLMKTCVNTVFGECFAIKGASLTIESLEELKQPYLIGTIPDGVLVITCGVDVQMDCIYYAIRGWGKDNKSWLLDYNVLFGDTDGDEVWKMLDKILRAPIGTEKKKMKIRYTCIDCGYRPYFVYAYCRTMLGYAAPCKGFPDQSAPIRKSAIEVSVVGQRFKTGESRFNIDDGYFKSLLFSRIVNQDWYLPSKVEEEYLKQVTAEEQIINEKDEVEWQRRYKNNHYLDAEKLNLVAASIIHVDLLDKPQEFQRVRSEGIDIWQ